MLSIEFIDGDTASVIFWVALIVSVIMWAFLANEFYFAACAKGFDSRKYFWMTFFLGILGALVVIALPDHGKRPQTCNNIQIRNNNNDLPEL